MALLTRSMNPDERKEVVRKFLSEDGRVYTYRKLADVLYGNQPQADPEPWQRNHLAPVIEKLLDEGEVVSVGRLSKVGEAHLFQNRHAWEEHVRLQQGLEDQMEELRLAGTAQPMLGINEEIHSLFEDGALVEVPGPELLRFLLRRCKTKNQKAFSMGLMVDHAPVEEIVEALYMSLDSDIEDILTGDFGEQDQM